jgi:hypothetical protein
MTIPGRAARCYREREWVVVSLPPEAAGSLEVARRRTRSLVHDAAGKSIEDMLVAAYLQGVLDGAQVAGYENARSAASEDK